jgi:hypothetical protein
MRRFQLVLARAARAALHGGESLPELSIMHFRMRPPPRLTLLHGSGGLA